MIDIIIPLYNGYSFFKECLESVLSSTEEGTYKIIIVNDYSTDKKLLDYLEELKKLNFEHIVIIDNEKNLGFVKSVNRGMQFDTKNDVVLLNSDTIVTKNWLKKMNVCAYSDKKIATVTTLTNNGTICSVPRWLQDNRIPDGFNLEVFADLVERVSKKEYIELPTAVGFCMLIKRTVLNEAGYFDEESYGKGYGEENDFSMRIKTYGYKNVLDDATFIFHKGHMSFSSEDFSALTQKNGGVLSNRYPTYNKDVEHFIKKQPLKNTIERIEDEMREFSNNNILYFIHSNPHASLGGSEKHTLHMVQIAQDFFNFVFLLYFDGSNLILERYSKHNKRETILVIKVELENNYTNEFESGSLNKIFEKILSLYSITNIHFQHLFRMPFSLIETAGKTKANVFITAHDYYLICPYPHLLKNNTANPSCINGKCNSCAENEYPKGYISQRRAGIASLLKQYASTVFFPSEYLQSHFKKYYPDISKKFITINHPYLINEEFKSTIREATEQKEKVAIAFVGSFSHHKGSVLFTQFALKHNNLYKFHIFGRIEDEENFNSIKDLVSHEEFSNIHELKKNIVKHHISLILILSIVPETFSFTLSESLLLNVPIVASNIGALGERLKNNSLAVLFNLDHDIPKTISNLEKAVTIGIKNPPQQGDGFNLKKYNEIAIEKYKKAYKN